MLIKELIKVKIQPIHLNINALKSKFFISVIRQSQNRTIIHETIFILILPQLVDNESEYFSETLAAESLSQYQSSSPLPTPPSVAQSQPPAPTTTSPLPPSTPSHHNTATRHQQQQNYVSSQNNQPKQQQPQQFSAQSQKYQATSAQQQLSNHHHNSNNYPAQNYAQQPQQSQLQQQQLQQLQQQQMQQQPQSYNNIRHSVLQSSVNPSGGGGGQGSLAAPINQQKYYDQYDNYARPAAQNMPAYNNSNIVNNNQNPVYNNKQLQPNYGHAYPPAQQNNVAYNGGGGYTNHYNQQMQYNSHEHGGGGGHTAGGGGGNGGGIGKISDYDPLTDGPRNIPNATRPSSTLIYSSDRGMGKLYSILSLCQKLIINA